MLIEYIPTEELRRAAFTLVAEGKRVKLEPGQNHVDDDVWNEIKKHPNITKRIESGAIKVHATTKTKTQPKEESKAV